ncbi:TonB-dependent receptor [Sphingopyxis indica]|uniref:TonB-dependent receptor n=1 Tax=Sphingopyxis indica TaxID=436663 RepID=UPI002939321C|nr:TonB-dependent receptor [Sphingopyxis indica]
MAIGALVPAAPALAAEERRIEYNIEAEDLGEALKAVSRLSGKEIIFNSEAVLGKTAPRLHGTFNADEAVRLLLEGSDLVAQYRKDVIIIRGRSEPSGDLSDRSAVQSEIVVTGSRIRGGEPVSPLTVSTRSEIEKRGINDLGAFARDLVQNYSGGQNPGVGGGGQGGSENVTSSSALNLRGLGPDATLTIVNGHRVSYDASGQGVDISAIPLIAVDRVEVVTDGSSALYGSDAVGGVANVILRRDFDGALASARFGAATDGGDVEQQYSIIAGKRWQSGGLMAAFDYRHSTPITAGDRSYTQRLFPTAMLVTGQRQYSAIVAGHQRLTDNVTFEVDGSFNNRRSNNCVIFSATADCVYSGNDISVLSRSWSLSPTLKMELGDHWEFRLAGTVSESKTDQGGDSFLGGALSQSQRNLYTNRLNSFEASATGVLFAAPGGPAKFAAGLGIRDASFDINASARSGGATVTFADFTVNQHTLYAYGEFQLPLVSADNDIRLVNRLILSGAIRYEDVSSVGDVVTPKLGLIYAPSSDLALKFSWGKSFKAPTLYQTGQPKIGASQIGATFFLPPSPTPGTVLYLAGGNPDLKPERATNWTATASFTPRAVENLRIDVSYFRVKYRDRVVSPIPSNSQAFQAIYGNYVVLNPTTDQVLAAISHVPVIYDQGGGDPKTANVVAIVSNYLQNAARQSIEGIDLAADYKFALTHRDQIGINAAGSYLKSEQQLSAGQAVVQMAGIIFRPPHWRARSSIFWERDNFSLAGTFNYIGGSLDNRSQPYVRVRDYKSVDVVAQLKTDGVEGVFGSMSLTLSILNILNEKPGFVRTFSSQSYPYDSTNFPSIGRFVSFSISKAF